MGRRNQTPNVRATVQEIFEGLNTRSQNRWPSLRFDVMAVNDLVSPFLSAGFYYKTFMWPRAFWEAIYEPIIRRAAGLGSLSGKHDEGHYEKAFAFCDVLVIGAGPAGLMAALEAARAGADVILCEEDRLLGRAAFVADDAHLDGKPAAEWVAAVEAELKALPNVRIMPRTTVTGAYDGGQSIRRWSGWGCTRGPRPICRANVSGGSRRRRRFWRRGRWSARSPFR